MDRLKLDQEAVLHTYTRLPVEISKGEGVYLYDIYGKKYLDFASGIAVNALGYQHPKIQNALSQQMNQFLHLSNYFVSPSVAQLATQLTKHSFASKVFFSNSGTEANEAMIKLCRKWGRSIHPSKSKIIAIENGFHGRTMGAMTLSGKPHYEDHFAPLLPHVQQIPANDVSALKEAASEDVCGIIFECIQGEAGVHELTPAFLKAIEETCQEVNALMLIDEVQTGLMRTGKLFAHEHFNLCPDLVSLSKALGGGLPLGAMLVSPKLEKVLSLGDHGSTFGGNPLSASAGLALFSEITHGDFKSHLESVSAYLLSELEALMSAYPLRIKAIRGKGHMLGLEVGEEALRIRDLALEKGLILNVTAQSVIRLLPPLVIDQSHVDCLVSVLGEIFDILEKKD